MDGGLQEGGPPGKLYVMIKHSHAALATCAGIRDNPTEGENLTEGGTLHRLLSGCADVRSVC